MSLLELREANLARNDEYLRQLGFHVYDDSAKDPSSATPPKRDPRGSRASALHSSSSSSSVMPLVQRMQPFDYPQTEIERSAALARVHQCFPFRADEASFLHSYLSQVFCPAPAVMCTGPSGCGKTAVCAAVLETASVPGVYFLCSGYSTARQMIKCLWYTVQAALLRQAQTQTLGAAAAASYGDSLGAGAVSASSVASGVPDESTAPHGKSPNSFPDLVAAIALLVKASPCTSFPLEPQGQRQGPRQGLNIVLDRVDAADGLERGLAARLLRLSEFSHAGVKVVGIASRLPAGAEACGACLRVPFRAYTSREVEQLLLVAVTPWLREQEEQQQERQQEQQQEQEREPLRRTKEKKPAAQAFSFTEALVSHVLKTVLPHISSSTVHLAELLQHVLSVLGALPARLTRGGAGSSSAPSMKEIAAAVLDLCRESIYLPFSSPSFHSQPDAAANEDGEAADGDSGKAPTAIIPNRRLGASSSSSRGDSGMPFSADNIPSHWQALSGLSRVVHPTSLVANNGGVDLPKSRKYLLLAAHLASKNPKETDDFVFALKKKGRRKKEQAGVNYQAREQDHSRAAGARAFTLERLLSIYSQISIIGETNNIGSKRKKLTVGEEAKSSYDIAETIEKRFGDMHLFAAVNEMERQQFISRGPGWTVETPCYLAAVPDELACALAALLSFDLGSYLNDGRR